MLISQRHKVAFVHIPKCGGSTVRHQFSEITDIGTEFAGVLNHPVLGRVRLGHLPLWALHDHYRDAFEALSHCHSFALCRDVFDRFESAVSQHLYLHQGQRINNFNLDEVLNASQNIIEKLRADDHLVSEEYCHFIRQADFIFFQGNKVIDTLYPLSEIGRLVEDLSAATGVAASTTLHSNQTLNFRSKGSEKIIRQLSGATKRLLPLQAHARVKKAAKSLFTRGGSRHKGFAQKDPEIAKFIKEYYAQDIVLFDGVSK